MFWSDELAKQITEDSKYDRYWVDDMKTPSGRVHVGALRGVAIHALIHESLKKLGKESHFSYVFNDMDPMDGFPHYLPESFKRYMGMPLFKIPSPEPGFNSLAELYATEFKEVFNTLGFDPEIIWSSKRYGQGDFDAEIRGILDKVNLVRKLYRSISNYDKPGNWYPYQVICEQCGKVGSTITTGWDGKTVTYECRKDLVEWAVGCGHVGEIEPTGTNGKLMWKVDWATHWKVIGITIEGAGKDHMTDNGSHDLSSAICEQVLDYPTPFGFIYEWFLAKGGSKMSSSKGIGVSAKEISKTLPAEILRFMLVKTPYRRAITFDPSQNDSILQLFDEYDAMQEAYYQDPNSDQGRTWEMSQVEAPPRKKVYLARFRDVVNFIQSPSVDMYQKFTQSKGEDLTDADRAELDKRITFAKIWLENYAPEKYTFKVTENLPAEAAALSVEQKSYLQGIVKLLDQVWLTPDDFQQALYESSKSMGIKPKDAFAAIYLSLLGKTHGPKAAWLILENTDIARTRFTSLEQSGTSRNRVSNVVTTKSEHIALHPDFIKAYPSASVGYAKIEGINIKAFDESLEAERQAFVKSQADLTTEKLNLYPELLSYRKMYKNMGVDWHSKRPSPEALLRRIATGKGLYSPINTCVDAYNMAVLHNHISVGAFDADNLKTPVLLTIAKGGESEFFIGDKDTPTVLKAGEVSYFDEVGPYNLDYNYRDALRVAVTMETKNIWINAEGVFDITPEQVQKTLDEAIGHIQKYCGGVLVEKGMLVASDL